MSDALIPQILTEASEALLPCAADRRLQDLVAAWLLTCGGSETRKAYGGDFREFGAFVEKGFGRVSWDGLTGMGASAYAAWLKTRLERREIAPATAARKLASVSAFLEYCVSQGELPRNPLAKVKRPRVPKQPKSAVLSDEEVRKLLGVIAAEREEAEKGKLVAPVRAAGFNEMVFKVLLGTGCRISELLALRVCDVELCGEHGRLHFRCKGSEDHNVAVPRALAESVLAFARFVGVTGDKECVFLFANTKESAEKRIGRELVRLCKAVGIEKDVTPHVLRATVATSLHEKGVPVVHIQRLLNHKDISTTAVYIRRLSEESEVLSYIIMSKFCL
jgi:integrase/recombinase XerD